MRIVLQRVSQASVSIAGRTVGRIDRGFCLLLGITHGDTAAEADWLADKVAGLRLFNDADGRMNLGLADVGGSVLAVSQFTLYGDATRGNRPGFTAAAAPGEAEALVERFAAELRALGVAVRQGVFGAHMHVALVNDGPVTIWIESPVRG